MTQVSMRRGFTKSLALWGICSAIVLALSGLAVKAADTAKIEGLLKDATGGVLAQANVALKPPSGADKRTTTDAKGAFSFASLPAGTYSVTIESSGFQTTRYTNLALKEGQARQFDFSLRAGAVSSPVEIDITRPMSQTDIDRMFVPASATTPPPVPGGPHGTIAGRLLTGSGAAAPSIRVGVVVADSGLYGSPRTTALDTRTDSMGFYRLEVPPGRYFVVAGSEIYGPDTYFDRPVYFPGVPDAGRALVVLVSPGSYDTADFRLDPVAPVVILPQPPPVIYYYGPYRVSGQVVFSPQIIVPQPYPQPYPYPYPYTQVYPYPYPDLAGVQVILQSGNTVQRGCGAGRTAYSASVGWDGQFDLRSVSSGVYEVCVVQNFVGGRGGSFGIGGQGRTILYGPSTLVVDREIAGLRLDLGPVAIYR